MSHKYNLVQKIGLTKRANGGRANGWGDVVVGWGNVSGQGAQCVKWRLHAPAGEFGQQLECVASR